MSAALQPPGGDIVVAEGWRPGVVGAIVSLLAAYHCSRYGFGPAFEAKVAREFGEFLDRYDADHDRLFLALQEESEAASWGAPVTEQRFEWSAGR
jgi:hypothetical protein